MIAALFIIITSNCQVVLCQIIPDSCVAPRMEEIKNVTNDNGAVTIHFSNDQIIDYVYIWLRDHCRCSVCYRSDTQQRIQHLFHIPDSDISDLKFDKDRVYITWDDNHESVYQADFLIQFDYNKWILKQRHNPVLWQGDKIAEKVAKTSFQEFLNSSDTARYVFQSLLDYGIALIENVEPTEAGTEKVCNALGGIQHTMYGTTWIVHQKFEHADVAYTDMSLACHTDLTYSTEAAGLQIFQSLGHTEGSGGENFLVDGFYCAQRLKKEFPEDYKFLTNFDVDFEYIEKGHNQRHSAPVITVDKMDEIKQIRFNNYDRASMAFSNREDCRAYYRSLKNLLKYFEDPSNQWKIKLKPGTVLALDNFRILHGRTSYTGNRVLCGSYVSRTDWLDRARTLGLID
ncbi:trimethyllysine dioxygenase, mitochondrial-like [Battus philenor]|uniref:trimethyllysine dioxygenase, mitochondrial-like n=1 Tax=Battus philenor TaxID=42288 RepID=UPI0035CFAD75